MSGTQVRLGLGAVVAAALGLVMAAEYVRAGDPKTRDAVDKIAKAIQKGEKAEAAKLAGALKIDEIDEVMAGFKLRTKKGFGVGAKAGAIEPDGIELKLDSIEQKGINAATLKKEADALIEAGYRSTAILEVAHKRGWQEADKGKKTKKAWARLSEESRDASAGFVEAVKGGNADKVKAAATKLNSSCAACHAIFK
jgi:hypothetical protein